MTDVVYQTVKLVLIPLQKASHIHHEPVIIFSQMFYLPRLHTVPPGANSFSLLRYGSSPKSFTGA